MCCEQWEISSGDPGALFLATHMNSDMVLEFL